MAGKPKSLTLTHEERLRLINAPFPQVNIHGGRQWGGVSIAFSQNFAFGHGQTKDDDYDHSSLLDFDF